MLINHINRQSSWANKSTISDNEMTTEVWNMDAVWLECG